MWHESNHIPTFYPEISIIIVSSSYAHVCNALSLKTSNTKKLKLRKQPKHIQSTPIATHCNVRQHLIGFRACGTDSFVVYGKYVPWFRRHDTFDRRLITMWPTLYDPLGSGLEHKLYSKSPHTVHSGPMIFLIQIAGCHTDSAVSFSISCTDNCPAMNSLTRTDYGRAASICANTLYLFIHRCGGGDSGGDAAPIFAPATHISFCVF